MLTCTGLTVVNCSYQIKTGSLNIIRVIFVILLDFSSRGCFRVGIPTLRAVPVDFYNSELGNADLQVQLEHPISIHFFYSF